MSTVSDFDINDSALLDEAALGSLPDAKQTAVVSSKGVGIADRYSKFSLKEMEKWQSEIKIRVDEEENELRSKNSEYFSTDESTEEWRRKATYEAATEIMKQRRKKSSDSKWDLFPDLAEEFIWDIYGLGVFLKDPNVSEIFLNGFREVRIAWKDGTHTVEGQIVKDRDSFVSLVNAWIAKSAGVNQRLSFESPQADVSLPNGDRFHAIAYLGTDVINVSIRRHDFSIVSLETLLKANTLTEEVVNFLQAAVKGKCNIMVAGATGAGKTSMLRCLMTAMGKEERIITVEDLKEIGFLHFAPDRHCVELVTRKANTEGKGGFPATEMIRESMRMSPDRVIVGEVRGLEAYSMLLAMSQGNDGSMATIHADSAVHALGRLNMYIQTHPPPGAASMSEEVADKFIREAIDVVLFLKRDYGDIPRLREVITVGREASTKILTTRVFEWDEDKKELYPSNTDLDKRVMQKLEIGGWEGG